MHATMPGRHARFPTKRSSRSTLVFTTTIMMSFIILVLIAIRLLSFPTPSLDSPVPLHVGSLKEKRIDEVDDDGNRDQWIELISWQPRAVVYHNFLSKDECDHLINLGKPHMTKSKVVDVETGSSGYSRYRTSSSTFLERGQDETVRAIEQRIADFTFIPVEHGRRMQILHYKVGERYEPHTDYIHKELNKQNGGQLIATVLMYLSDVEEGGETVFPVAKGNVSSVPWWNELSECGKKGLSIKPKMGDALFFWNVKPDTTVDPSSLHGDCPIIKGNKWCATKWLCEEYVQ